MPSLQPMPGHRKPGFRETRRETGFDAHLLELHQEKQNVLIPMAAGSLNRDRKSEKQNFAHGNVDGPVLLDLLCVGSAQALLVANNTATRIPFKTTKASLLE
jgi:hypothetical protein